MRRNVYLAMKSLEEARGMWRARFGPHLRTTAEEIPAEEALGRVTAAPVFAGISAPTYHASAMDGIAVSAPDTYGATERHPKILEVGRNAQWVNTGEAIPEGCDSVIMVEKVHQIDAGKLEIRSPSYPWQHVRKVGEDIVATQLVLPQDHRIRPHDQGALLASGVFFLMVRQKPLVTIIPTGSELVDHRDAKAIGKLKGNRIIEFNSLILAGLVRECMADPEVYDIVPDQEEEIRRALGRAVASRADLILINAGSSAGSKDFTANILGEMGEVLVHGVAMMPGKPTILSAVEGKPVVGIPGYTVSATLCFAQFAQPILHTLQGLRPPRPKTVMVRPSRDIPSRLGIEEFVRVNIGQVGTKRMATPLPRAAGSITTLTRAEGIVRIPALSEGITQDENVEAELLVDEEGLRNTVVVIGSHDITIDILGDEVRRRGNAIRISSGNVGSIGGLMALRKGTCHMAGSHLLDTETGEYNLSYIRKYLKGLRVSVFHLALRDQGLMVAKGNPKGIKGLEDLAGDGVVFVNRQQGSGTRILLDFHLCRLGLSPERIAGYGHEEFTHMAVAVDVLSGAADCGMGIFAAARALDLDFIPVAREQYDLIVPSSERDDPNVALVLETLKTLNFRERVISLGGYDPSKSGQLWTEVS